ncbi:Unknown protein, partial [Striga hermonthica]
WSTKGRVACPSCGVSTHSLWLTHGKKFCYMAHRRWLDPNHPFRYQKDEFDGTEELQSPPVLISESEVLRQLHGMKFVYGKSKKISKRSRETIDRPIGLA